MKLSLVVLFLSLSANANLFTQKLDYKEQVSAPRWIWEKDTPKPSRGIEKRLAMIRESHHLEKYQECLSRIQSTRVRAKSLRPWLNRWELICARRNLQKNKVGRELLEKAVTRARQNESDFIMGAAKDLLREAYIDSLLVLFQNLQKGSRKKAWQIFDEISRVSEWLSDKQRAKAFEIAGELAFIQQRLPLSYDYYLRSLSFNENSRLREKFNSVRDLLIERNLLPAPKTKDKGGVEIDLEASEDENKLLARMNTALQAGDLVPAVEDGVKLISQFPSGLRADKASDKILRVYINVLRKKDNKYKSLLRSLRKQLVKAPADRVFQWAKRLAYRGYYSESIVFANEALDGYESRKDIHEVYYLIGVSAFYIGKDSEANKSLNKVVELGAGSEEAEKALYKLGLLQFRLGELSKSAAYFERILASRKDGIYTLQSMYWLWRSLQGLDVKRAEKLRKELIVAYPLTYYGLRARAEGNNNKLEWKNTHALDEEFELKLTSSENAAWERFLILLKSGWFEEAQAELSLVPETNSAMGMVIMSKYWHLAFNHLKATKLIQEAWDKEPKLMQPNSIVWAYPIEFPDIIDGQVEKYNIRKELIYSLIKQESGFKLKAESPAGALGLMQLMPATAKGVAKRLRIKNLRIPEDLFDPTTNIKLGTSYLSQMLRAFDGHLPLALAAYNAGIGRMRRWLSHRPNLSRLSEAHTSTYRNEVWIDELPWSETSFYVKAILRNYLVYQLISKESVQLPDPIWYYQ